MKRIKKSSAGAFNPLLAVVFTFAIALCVISVLIALIISIDRADELFNSVRYQDNWHQKSSIYENRWEPFENRNYIQCVLSIPKNLYIALLKFPTSFLIGLIFLPLLVVVVPVYEGFYLGEATMLLLAWLPLVLGIALLACAGLMAEMDRVKKKILAKENQPKALIPVCARPRISAWMSCVPS